MQWQKKDMQQFISAKEYVDTLLIPLMPIQFAEDHDLETQAYQGELLKIFVSEIEKQFKGRIFLTPNYNYLVTADRKEEVVRLNDWIRNVKQQPFKHVFLFSFDPQWKKTEQDLQGNLLWLPTMKKADLNDESTKNIIKDQIEQMTEMIQSYW